MGKRANIRTSWRVCAMVLAALLVPVALSPSSAHAQTSTEPSPAQPPPSVPSGPEPGTSAPGTSEPTDPTTPPPGDLVPEPAQSPKELIPPPIDLEAINTLLEERRAAAVASATQIAEANNAEAAAMVTLAQKNLEDLSAQRPAGEKLVEDREAARKVADRTLKSTRDTLGDVAVETYQMAVSGSDARLRGRAASISSDDEYQEYVRVSTFGEAAWGSIRKKVDAEEKALTQAESELDKATRALKDLDSEIREAQQSVERILVDAERIRSEGDAAIEQAAATGEELVTADLGPTILGETLVSAEDMAAFVAQRGRYHPALDIEELARLFESEGNAEGVRGDIALAQSIIETGNFGFAGSMVEVEDFNYAGIGACDSCKRGFIYESMQMGVRDQMQLLHTYADKNLTSDDLAFDVVRKAPEKSGVRGCCETWMELSGVWATGPGYGVKILTIYNEMLRFAADRENLRKLSGAL